MLTAESRHSITDELFDAFELRVAKALAPLGVHDDDHVSDIGAALLAEHPRWLTAGLTELRRVVADFREVDPAIFEAAPATRAELEQVIFAGMTHVILDADDRRAAARSAARKADFSGETGRRRAAYPYRRAAAHVVLADVRARIKVSNDTEEPHAS
jgi:hypothetical protein